jgi:hypothetical protein
MYSGHSFYYSKFVSELLLSLSHDLPHTLLIYAFSGLSASFNGIALYFLASISILVFGTSYGLTVGAVSPSPNAANVIGVTGNIFFTLSSGIYSNPKTISSIIRLVSYVSPISYGFRMAMQSQLLYSHMGTAFPGTTGEKLLESYGIDDIKYGTSLVVILSLSLVSQAIGSITINRRTAVNLKVHLAPDKG